MVTRQAGGIFLTHKWLTSRGKENQTTIFIQDSLFSLFLTLGFVDTLTDKVTDTDIETGICL